MTTKWGTAGTRAARHAAAVVVGVMLVLVPAAVDPSTAFAQSEEALDEEARALFESATIAFQSGRYEVALDRFREALELSGRAELYYNIGISADRLRLDGVALEAFRMYLAGVPGASNRADVEARMRVLEDAIATGREAEDASETQTDADVEPPSPRETAEASPAPEEDGHRTAPDPDERRDSDSDSGSILSRWWFWTIVGVAVASTVAVVLVVALADGGVQDPIPGSNGRAIETLSIDSGWAVSWP